MHKTDLWTALLITTGIFIPLMIIMGIIAALLLRSLHYEKDKNFAPGEDFWNGLQEPRDEKDLEPVAHLPFTIDERVWKTPKRWRDIAIASFMSDQNLTHNSLNNTIAPVNAREDDRWEIFRRFTKIPAAIRERARFLRRG